MCHLILLMPVLALPIFWLMPLNLAIPIYTTIALMSGLVYRLIAKSMRKRPETGSESLVGATAEVISKLNPGDLKYLVRSQGELWSASSPDILSAGEMVSIAAVDGIRLVVHRNGKSAIPTKESVRKADERHYH